MEANAPQRKKQRKRYIPNVCHLSLDLEDILYSSPSYIIEQEEGGPKYSIREKK